MNIGFLPKVQLYHFVLFYNLSPVDLLFYRKGLVGKEDDNALLTYCYYDNECGISYKAFCFAKVDNNGKIRWGDQSPSNPHITIRANTLHGDVVVADEESFEVFADAVDMIKNIYGYRKDLVELDEDDPYCKFRHLEYPQDIYTVFLDANLNREMIWVREQEKLPDGSIVALMIDEPFAPSFGIHEGDTVKIQMTDEDPESGVPYAILPWMNDPEIMKQVEERYNEDIDISEVFE